MSQDKDTDVNMLSCAGNTGQTSGRDETPSDCICSTTVIVNVISGHYNAVILSTADVLQGNVCLRSDMTVSDEISCFGLDLLSYTKAH